MNISTSRFSKRRSNIDNDVSKSPLSPPSPVMRSYISTFMSQKMSSITNLVPQILTDQRRAGLQRVMYLITDSSHHHSSSFPWCLNSTVFTNSRHEHAATSVIDLILLQHELLTLNPCSFYMEDINVRVNCAVTQITRQSTCASLYSFSAYHLLNILSQRSSILILAYLV